VSHPFGWHRCERWWKVGLECPYGGGGRGRGRDPGDENIPFIPPVPARQTRAETGRDTSMHKSLIDSDLDRFRPVQPVIKPIPTAPPTGPREVPRPIPNPIPFPGVPGRPPGRRQPWNPGQPGRPIPQRERPAATAAEALTPFVTNPAGQVTDFQRQGGTEAWTRALSQNLDIEYQNYLKQAQSVSATSNIADLSGSAPPPGGNIAENRSSALAEVALAEHFGVRARVLSPGSKEAAAAVEEAERVVRGGGQGNEEERSGKKSKVPAAVAIAATTAATIEAIRRFGQGPGPGAGSTNLRGRGGFHVRERLTPAVLGFRRIRESNTTQLEDFL